MNFRIKLKGLIIESSVIYDLKVTTKNGNVFYFHDGEYDGFLHPVKSKTHPEELKGG